MWLDVSRVRGYQWDLTKSIRKRNYSRSLIRSLFTNLILCNLKIVKRRTKMTHVIHFWFDVLLNWHNRSKKSVKNFSFEWILSNLIWSPVLTVFIPPKTMSLFQIEALLNQYSSEFDCSLNLKEKKRRLKCGFCNCLFKYQVCLNHHVFARHMVDLKKLSDFERRSFIRFYLEDDRDITYAQFHTEYFAQKTTFSLYMND